MEVLDQRWDLGQRCFGSESREIGFERSPGRAQQEVACGLRIELGRGRGHVRREGLVGLRGIGQEGALLVDSCGARRSWNKEQVGWGAVTDPHAADRLVDALTLMLVSKPGENILH